VGEVQDRYLLVHWQVAVVLAVAAALHSGAAASTGLRQMAWMASVALHKVVLTCRYVRTLAAAVTRSRGVRLRLPHGACCS
jgi:hypothetical protein